jgi:hypothetical protein
MPYKLEVSVACYNEIAQKLEAQGYKFGENLKELTLEKGTSLKHPIDYRAATMRKDAAMIYATARKDSNDSYKLEAIEQLYQYILTGELPKPDTPDIQQTTVSEWN